MSALSSGDPSDNRLAIDGDRLLADLSTLATFGGGPDGIDRPAFSDAYRDAAEWLTDRMVDAGLSVRTDAAGNIIGRLGPDTGPAVVCGSHIDSVPNGGTLDGTFGVLAGLEAARRLAGSRLLTDRALEIIAFNDEEGAYLGMLGARAMTGAITAEDVDRARGRDGEPLAKAMTRYGLDPAGISGAARPAQEIAAYVELHIEQGPVLEQAGCDIGIASSIVGLHTSQLCFRGEANHAGTTPMTLRRDAFRAATETVAAAFGCVNADGDPSLRLTYGAIDVAPGASNVVPSQAVVTQEIRAAMAETIDDLFGEIAELSRHIARRNGVSVEHEILHVDAPAPMSPRIMGAIDVAADDLGLKYMTLPSGAGHDAQYVARLCDTGLIFVPSRDGISHNPREYTEPAQLVAGANVLLRTLDTLLKA